MCQQPLKLNFFLPFPHFNLAAAKHSSSHNQAAVLSLQSICMGGSIEHGRIFVFPLGTAAIQSSPTLQTWDKVNLSFSNHKSSWALLSVWWGEGLSRCEACARFLLSWSTNICLNSLDKLLTANNYHLKQPNLCQEGECLLSGIIVVSTGVLSHPCHSGWILVTSLKPCLAPSSACRSLFVLTNLPYSSARKLLASLGWRTRTCLIRPAESFSASWKSTVNFTTVVVFDFIVVVFSRTIVSSFWQVI